MKRAERRQTGFTLIETMVALLVLSVGMIGIAALHGQALSASGTAIYRSQAMNLAGSMADRIRVNRLAGTAYEGPASDNSCDVSTSGTAVDCSPANMAANDLFIWQAEIAGLLPGGTGEVDVDMTSSPATYTVTVGWDEPASADPVRFSLEFQLQRF